MSAARLRRTGWVLRSLCLLTGAAAVVVSSGVVARIRYARNVAQRTTGESPNVCASDGVLLYTEVDGADPAPVTVVFAHGFAADSQEFAFQRKALAGRHRLVFFDQRGHGSSGWGGRKSATINQLGDDLGRVIDEQPESPVLLVAHSMGGMAAIALASQRPDLFGERIIGVALLSTAGGHLPSVEVPGRLGRIAGRSGAATVAAHLLWLVAPLIDRVAPFRRRWGRRWLLHRLFGGGDPPENAANIMLRMWISTPLSMITAFYSALVRYDKSDQIEALRSVPVLVLCGEEDHAIPSEGSTRLARNIGSNARLVMVKGAGHMVNLTHPDEVNEALCELLVRAEP